MPREAVKKLIVAIVQRAGEIDGTELFNIIYENRRDIPKRTALKAHIWQLRKQGFPIRGVQIERRQWIYRWG